VIGFSDGGDEYLNSNETSHILWNPEVHYPIHKSPSLNSILSQMNPTHVVTVWFFDSTLTLPSFHAPNPNNIRQRSHIMKLITM